MNDLETSAEPDQEIVDLYDSHGQPLDITAPRYSELEKDVFRQVAHVCLFYNGRMLIQLRSMSKRKHRGKWDFTSSGSVKAGETIQQAASRELFEELGISHDFTGYRPVVTFVCHPMIHGYFVGILEEEPDTFVLRKSEVDGVCWADKVMLRKLMQAKMFIEDDEILINKLFNAYKRIMKKQKRSEEIV